MLATNSKFWKTLCRPKKTHSQAELAHRLPAFGLWLKGNGQKQKHVKKTKTENMKIIHNFPISKHHKILLEKELWDNHSQNHNMFGLQKSSGLLEVVREVPCSSPYLLQFPQSRIYSFWWSELIFFHLSLRYITVFCLFVWGFFLGGGCTSFF